LFIFDESDAVCFVEFDEADELIENDDPAACKYFDRLKNEFQMPQVFINFI
jgi:hypothetical protein